MPLEQYKKYVSTMKGIPDTAYYPHLKKFGIPKAVYPGEIADSVNRIAEDKNRYKQLSRASYQISKKKFSLENHIDRLLEIMKKLN